jgi:hypothetical protein
MPPPSSTPPKAANWWGGCGRGGRPERAATTGIRAAARAGHHAAATAVTKVSSRAAAMAPQGIAKRSMRWWETDCKVGTIASQAANPTTATAAAVIPTEASLASMTRRI